MVPKLKNVFEINGNFWVPDYQRGYRWSQEEVTQLLNDIWELTADANSKRMYCLQPLVVKKLDDTSQTVDDVEKTVTDRYELIDGQQRLTTIRIILSYLNSVSPIAPINYAIDYETRKETQGFLCDIDTSKANDNIDFFFISNAYTAVKDWFDKITGGTNTTELKKFKFAQLLAERVQFIWYEADPDMDAIALFTRLNIGRIPLTDSELTKALFLCEDSSIEKTMQNEIVQQWDMIEKHLHRPEFWGFLTNEKAEVYQTLIDLMLNMLSGKTRETREKHFSFYFFQEKIKKASERYKVWTEIWTFYLRLCEWFDDREIYHKVGYLVAVGDEHTLINLLKEAETKSKKQFRASLDEKIAKSIDFDGQGNTKLSYDDLSYDNTEHQGKIKMLLLLFNVQSMLNVDDPSLLFPFGKYKEHKHGTWSLEHIHAQQSEGLPKMEQQQEWLRLHLPSIEAICPDQRELIDKVRLASENEQLKGEQFRLLADEVLSHLSPEGSTEYIHELSNMALLSTGANAALNNATFDVKRNKIIEMDKKGEYIPYCTRMVFLKYYTKSDENQLHFWGKADRTAYLQEMDKVLRPYLTIIGREIK